MKQKIVVHWFRRDLRLEDNASLHFAQQDGLPAMGLFIFDDHILDELPPDDARVNFIYDQLEAIDKKLKSHGSSLYCVRSTPEKVWAALIDEFHVEAVYYNKDYEPYAMKRDRQIADTLEAKGIEFKGYKDQVIFEESEVMKPDGSPYTVYTPYMKQWRKKLGSPSSIQSYKIDPDKFTDLDKPFPSREELGIQSTSIKVLDPDLSVLDDYKATRDYPDTEGTSRLSPHLRFGTVSVRKLVQLSFDRSPTFLNELVWREFFMQILFHFPEVVHSNFKRKYDMVQWRNDEDDFKRWCDGQTGIPMVDAGMRELNQTGYMHNRVRMIVASFLCKHLLIDWRWGEAYFAKKLLDFELASNNGNWQWAAGTGCDAAPYFRIFNPETQREKFDPKGIYVNRWIPELNTDAYPQPIVDLKEGRQRALDGYKMALADA